MFQTILKNHITYHPMLHWGPCMLCVDPTGPISYSLTETEIKPFLTSECRSLSASGALT